MVPQQQLLVDFVEGTLSPLHFRDALYNDPEMEKLLLDDPGVGQENYVSASGGAYYFCLCQSLDEPAGVLNAWGAIRDWLDRHSIAYNATDQYEKQLDDLIDCYPAGAEPSSEFIYGTVLKRYDPDRDGPRKLWLEQELKRLYQYQTSPPDWIQGSQWPMGADSPMYFIGSLPVSDVYHDDAVAYVFVDLQTGKTETVIQVA